MDGVGGTEVVTKDDACGAKAALMGDGTHWVGDPAVGLVEDNP